MKRYVYSTESSVGIAGVVEALGQRRKDESLSRVCHRYEKFLSIQACHDPSRGSDTTAASSTSSTIHQSKYDVFLSFRGEDTRNNFTSHVYAALRGKQIQTFIDNDLRRGEEISPSLLEAIEGSKLAVVIFSPNYAASRWCLDELVKILECKNTNGQIVVPVFYHVDPSHVRHQNGSFKDAFALHEVKEKMDKVERWRSALKETANISGWDSQVVRDEAELIEKTVEDVLKKLNRMYSTESLGLVGIDSRTEKIESLLCLNSPEVQSVGIWGMGGIGKTTIAEVVFNRNHSKSFEGFYFLANVREELKRHGAVALWNRFLMEILDESGSSTGTLMSLRPSFMEERLKHRKLLVVFDDVDDSMPMQFQELLARHHSLFGKGSKILITSRDKQVLKNLLVDEVYKVEELTFVEAFQVFSFSAFKNEYPSANHINQSVKMVRYAKGNPLALKVLGSALFDKSEEEWSSLSRKLEKVSKPRIMDVLKISYAGLSDEEQSIFLDIACLFKGENRDYATKVLEGCYSCAHFFISTLIDKSLVTISRHNSVVMHDLVQEMGWGIVRRESVYDPGKRSRLWDPEDVYYVLTRKKGTEAIESIILDLSDTREMHIESDGFARMERLRFLKFWKSNNSVVSFTNKVHLPYDGLQFLSNELRYLHWERFPSKSLPSSFCAENLVLLDLPHSEVHTLWTGVQQLVNLKRINLTWSLYLTEIPDLSKAQMIEEIILRGCENLTGVPERIDSKFLRLLDLSFCKNLKRCPEISGKLEELYLGGTGIEALPQSLHNLKFLRLLFTDGLQISKFPEIPESITMLRLNGTAMEEVPSSIEFLTRLVELSLSDNKQLSSLPESIGRLKSLKYLNLDGCRNLKRLPKSISSLKSLASLSLNGTDIKELPINLHKLVKLSTLEASYIEGVNLLPLVGLRSLTSLYLEGSYPSEISHALWSLSSLTRLCLRENSFTSLPADIIQLHQLQFLYLSNCRHIRSLPPLPPFLQILFANNCVSLETISPIESDFLNTLNLANCFRLDQEVCNKIMEEAVLTVPHVPKQFIYMRADVQILLPGREIPQWFSEQTRGSTAMVQLLPSCHHLKGMAYCVVFALDKFSRYLPNLKCVCKAKANNGDFISDWECYPYESPKSSHVLLWYTSSTATEKDCFSNYTEALFEFYFEWEDKWGTKHVNDCEIKKCGVHLFFHENQLSEFPIENSDEDSYSTDEGYYYINAGEGSCPNVDDASDDLNEIDSEEYPSEAAGPSCPTTTIAGLWRY